MCILVFFSVSRSQSAFFVDNLSDERDTFVVASHAGHCGRATAGGQIYSLAQQVTHRLALVDALLGDSSAAAQTLLRELNVDVATPSSPMVILGHSIGAYINMKVACQRPQAPIVSVVNLFPTFR